MSFSMGMPATVAASCSGDMPQSSMFAPKLFYGLVVDYHRRERDRKLVYPGTLSPSLSFSAARLPNKAHQQ
jgi:hypothetical protein